ncbi:hypothetical protein CI1B_43570 [Bradyrhizobium ivorense]|uniref:Uncharacterized protein n=1 Tax=Bradyrhizobium ivorense TaxID=2511166 RepID=A0A508TE68_9BRAD|nr:hypothetical protein CI1B_43570 [Bradyrhizobium ivorense]
MAHCVFTGTIVLPDRMTEDGYVLVGDGKVQAVGAGAALHERGTAARAFWCCPVRLTPKRRSQLGQQDFVWSTRSADGGGVLG